MIVYQTHDNKNNMKFIKSHWDLSINSDELLELWCMLHNKNEYENVHTTIKTYTEYLYNIYKYKHQWFTEPISTIENENTITCEYRCIYICESGLKQKEQLCYSKSISKDFYESHNNQEINFNDNFKIEFLIFVTLFHIMNVLKTSNWEELKQVPSIKFWEFPKYKLIFKQNKN